ncbi:glycosyltransferase [Flavobacterium aestivum]|uniref:glycosyltransferase n=1 Tax=Flavobacterium aestivum TaxID=3003257 RepID=UPI00248321BA|nr:glycosyltransferase [Flavobacterium aestivum]
MLSILIPTYNYNIHSLVLELHKQCTNCKIEFEIISLDDHSKESQVENQKINSITNCSFEILDKNIGRSAIRNLLARKAIYTNLLFLDADTFPVNNSFISDYLKHINTEEKIVYGGILYKKEKPAKNQLLRWFYGKSREALSVEDRNTNPYLSFLTLNFLIKKSIIEKVSFNESLPNLRHEDTLFSYNLKQKEIKISHIQNPVYHLGLDEFEVAIQKESDSIIALKYLIDNKLLPPDYVRLSRIFTKLKRLNIVFVFSYFYKITRLLFLKNLSSKNPSLFIFDLYRLGYLCMLENK